MNLAMLIVCGLLLLHAATTASSRRPLGMEGLSNERPPISSGSGIGYGGQLLEVPSACVVSSTILTTSLMVSSGFHAFQLERNSIPMRRGWSAAPAVKAMTIWPLLLAVAVKVSSSAASLPAVA